ncbi:hypothetical protein G9A89_018925 [Geosiphon pyriformis]|nr:hypothetical protein G9A89_018925 [Geosiphon pyriformis]
MNKFDGVQVFTFGLESGYLGANITIIMNASLAKHMLMVLGLYADATLEKRLAYSYVINSIVVEALNGSTFVVLGGDFNKNDFGHSSNLKGVKKCINFILVSNGLHSSSFNQRWTLVWGASSILSLIQYADRLQKKNEDTKSFGNTLLAAALKTADDFEYHTTKNDINGIWTLLCQMVCSTVEATFLELLVAKILNAYKSENLERFQALVNKWVDLDFDQAVEFRSFLGNSHDRVLVEQSLAHFRKLYRFHKFLDFKVTEDSWIQMAIDKCIKAFVNNKSQMIRSVLEKPFKKVTLDHLVDDRDLVLEPDLVKGRVDSIMEN